VIWINYDLILLKVLLGLGSNLGSSRAAFEGCLEELAAKGRVVDTSRLWSTRAIGPEQPDYFNAAALIEWPSGPRSLLASCLELEAAAGRDRSREEKWGPRTLDLDLLLAETTVCRGPGLVLPHPQFHLRRFALEPAAEVAPDWVHPLLGLTVEELAEEARKREPDAILDVTNFEF
jgi:2-amino-4-hydroxy-6-hydroxymethyldihydropteridine diphosphokinase